MPIKDALVPEFDLRRLLERVPEAEFAWKPHDKSMSLGELAGHIANLPRWCSITLESTTFDLDTFADARPRQPESRAAVVRSSTRR